MPNLSNYSFIILIGSILIIYSVVRYVKSRSVKNDAKKVELGNHISVENENLKSNRTNEQKVFAEVFYDFILTRKREMSSEEFIYPNARLELKVQYYTVEASQKKMFPLEILQILTSFTMYEVYIQKENPIEELDKLESYFKSHI